MKGVMNYMSMNGINEAVTPIINGVFSAREFYLFMNDYEFAMILLILTMAFALLLRNGRAIFAQVVMFLAFWIQHWVANSFSVLIIELTWFKYLNAITYSILFTLQVLAFAVILYEVHKAINRSDCL